MGQSEINPLPDFTAIRDQIVQERQTIIKVNNFSDEDAYVRTTDDAILILDFIEETFSPIWTTFKEHPSLAKIFKEEYTPFNRLISRENIVEMIFLDDCLLPEKEMFFFGQDGGINPKILELHKKGFEKWAKDVESKHNETQELIKSGELGDKKSSDLKCQCSKCNADFRAKLRDIIFETSLEIIDKGTKSIEENIQGGITLLSDIFTKMQKDLDKNFYKVRYRLKRSTLNRLENQVKNILKERFCYPTALARDHRVNLFELFDGLLVAQDYSSDLISDEEYDRFFLTLQTNIWKNERYLEREFKKFVKSIVILKKKDVSSTILQEYLGEFWVHSVARDIKRKIVYHMGPTNSGKTYHAIEKLSSVEKGCYLAPLRLLAAELYDTLNGKGCITTLLTGEEVIEKEGSTHYSSTIEMARFGEFFDCCVIDEIQMITDPQRGWAWTRALVNIFAEEVHLCGDASALDLVKVIVDLCGDELEIKEYNRMTELAVMNNQLTLSDLEKNDALIVFSRKNALRYKRDLERVGFKVSIVYGRLSPEVRREQARKFDHGETDIMVSTDAIAMGMNLPIKRIVFSTLSKFFNAQEHEISTSEIKQIAGRAGRYQRFPKGLATCLKKVEDGNERVKEALECVLEQSTKCMVGPDLDIFNQVNNALVSHNLPKLSLSEFLRLFNTMVFKKPFYCVELKEMIELAEMVEESDPHKNLSDSEIFGFACAPVNLGLIEHVQHFMWILNKYVNAEAIPNELIDYKSSDIDYLETSIKCVELYQWLSRHFNNKNFFYDEHTLLNNKQDAVDKLNTLLSEKIVPTCSSCGCKLPEDSKFPICDECFQKRRFTRRPRRPGKDGAKTGSKNGRGGKGKSRFSKGKPSFKANKSGRKVSKKRKFSK
jgi:ATP-dependent RNA helicase SUPV3L1/SUV3